jgi:hypothetical protein
MVLFRVKLNLNNFEDVKNNRITANKEKATQILRFYKVLGKMIVYLHNSDNKTAKKHIKEYYEPNIKLLKNVFVFRDIDNLDNELMQTVFTSLFPPSIELDFKFKQHTILEKKAIDEFVKISGIKVKDHTPLELKTLYYSTKITNFITNLNNMLHKNEFWIIFTDKYGLKTKYIPNIDISDSCIYSLY